MNGESVEEPKLETSTQTLGRRDFLATATGLAALLAADRSGAEAEPLAATSHGANSAGVGPLAIDGGAPVRATKLRTNYPGPLYYDDEERRERGHD